MDTARPCTLPEFAKLVDLSVQSAHRYRHNGTLIDGAPLSSWIAAYCGKLRAAASGRGGDDQAELVRQKAREARHSADLKAIAVERELGTLVHVGDLEADLAAWAISMRSEVESGIDRLVAELESRHGFTADPDYIDLFAAALLDRLAAPDLGAEPVAAETPEE